MTEHLNPPPTALAGSHLLAPPSCSHEAGSLCATVYHVTGSDWLAGSADWLIARPARIVLIIVLALVIRWLAHRAIGRLVRHTADANVPGVLRPLAERVPAALLERGPLLSERHRQRAETIGSVLRSITSVVIFVVAFLLVLGELGINLAPLLASAGIAGVAIGFGAQNLVKDFLSGIFMILEDQYGVGDVVDVGTASGTVEAVGLRTTRLRDGDGAVWYVRNGEILRVGNRSQGWGRVVLDVPVAYGTDLDRALAALTETAEGVCADEQLAASVLEPPTVTGVETMTADGLTLRVLVTTLPLQQYPLARALRAAITARFAADGIAAPYPRGTAMARPEPQQPPAAPNTDQRS